jgi:hypothetical protein
MTIIEALKEQYLMIKYHQKILYWDGDYWNVDALKKEENESVPECYLVTQSEEEAVNELLK